MAMTGVSRHEPPSSIVILHPVSSIFHLQSSLSQSRSHFPMPASLAQIDTYLADNSDRFLEELKDFLRIPSVSADSRHKADVRRAAEFVMAQFRSLGLTA